jgi:uncharacterized protein (DUF1697 family)
MTVYIGLLRAVNLGEGTIVRMEALRTLLRKEGLEDVQTLLQSGNLVFRSASSNGSQLEQPLGEKIARTFRVKTDLFLRSATQWSEILTANPFTAEAKDDPARLVVLVLHDAPTAERWKALREAIRGRESVRGAGRHGYIYYPDGQGRSKFTIALIESKLGTPGTVRNWNTASKLGALADALERPGSASP